MSQVTTIRDFVMGGILLIALIPMINKGINIVAPNLGQVETILLFLIPLTYCLKWIIGLTDAFNSNDAGRNRTR